MYVCACVYICVGLCLYTGQKLEIFIQKKIKMYVCACVYMICMHTCVCVYMICMYTCVRVCIFVYRGIYV